MFVDLLATLRCPNAHEDSPLVATATRTVDRRIVEGVLGCPVCRAEFPVHEGAVEFPATPREAAASPAALFPAAVSTERLLRLGALLGLDDRGGVYVLDASGAALAGGLAAHSPASQFIAVSADGRAEGAGIVLRGRGATLPLARACARGILVDDPAPALMRSAVLALQAAGRLVAPADAPVPDGIDVLAKDAEQWVGERRAEPVLAAIRRAPR